MNLYISQKWKKEKKKKKRALFKQTLKLVIKLLHTHTSLPNTISMRKKKKKKKILGN